MIAKATTVLRGFSGIALIILFIAGTGIGCSGNGDPSDAVLGMSTEPGHSNLPVLSDNEPGAVSGDDRFILGGWFLSIDAESGIAEVVDWDRSLAVHFDVTSFVKKPACTNCLRLDDFSFDKENGLIDCDAVLINPTVHTAYDVRAVLLIDEWETGRRLVNEAGLTDFWSGDPYHPDPFMLFATETEERVFGPGAEHSSHVTLSLPQPYNLLVPFIVDASYPDHPNETVEIVNVEAVGEIHPTGYDLVVTAEILDWQDDAQLYLDCSPLNPVAGLCAFSTVAGGAAGETYSNFELHLKSDITDDDCWMPTALGEFELAIVALDPVSTSRTFTRFTVEVTEDNTPPVWDGSEGIDEVWWGSQRAVISYNSASDPSGPVLYNIYSTTDIPLIPPSKNTMTGSSHYSVETVDGATYSFRVSVEDQAGNESENEIIISGMTRSVTELWSQSFAADLESHPNVRDINADGIGDIIFGCDDGYVYNLNAQNGTIQWAFETSGMVKSSPAIRDVNDDDILDVIAGSNDSSIYAINTVFGSPFALKTYTTSNLVESSPVCADVTGDGVPEVIAGSFDNNIYAFEGGTGDLLVSYDTGSPVKATPALEDFNQDNCLDLVVASGGYLRAINGLDGTLMWSYNFNTGFSLGSPAIADLNNDGTGDVVAGCNDGVYAFDVAGNALLWSNTGLEGDFDTSPALGDISGDGVPDVAISSRYQRVFVLDGVDGSLIWASNDNIYMPTCPVLGDLNDDGIIDVAVGSADFYLRVLNGADGYTLVKYDTSQYGAITTIPLIIDSNTDGNIDVIYGTEGHYMFAVTLNRPVPDDLDLLPWPKYMRARSNTGNLELPLY